LENGSSVFLFNHEQRVYGHALLSGSEQLYLSRIQEINQLRTMEITGRKKVEHQGKKENLEVKNNNR